MTPELKLIPNHELKSRGLVIQSLGIFSLLLGISLGIAAFEALQGIFSPILGGLCILGGIGGLVYFLRKGYTVYKEGKVGLPEGEKPEPESPRLHSARLFVTLIATTAIVNKLGGGAMLLLLLLASAQNLPPSSYLKGYLVGTLIWVPILGYLVYRIFPRYKSLKMRALVGTGMLIGSLFLITLMVVLKPKNKPNPLIDSNKERVEEKAQTSPRNYEIPDIHQNIIIPAGWSIKQKTKSLIDLEKITTPASSAQAILLTWIPIPANVHAGSGGDTKAILQWALKNALQAYDTQGLSIEKPARWLAKEKAAALSLTGPLEKGETYHITTFVFLKNNHVVYIERKGPLKDLETTQTDFETLLRSIKL